ncbi:MAG: hypothetical protein AAF661_05135 [Pseudomonadota bacterium]
MTRTAIYHAGRDAYLVRMTEPSPDPRTVHRDVSRAAPQWGDLEDALTSVDRETARRQMFRLPVGELLFCTTVPVT